LASVLGQLQPGSGHRRSGKHVDQRVRVIPAEVTTSAGGDL
jgi:hypothetical protein